VPSGITKPHSPHAFKIFSFFSAASTTPQLQMIYHMPNCCFCNHGGWLSLCTFHWGFWCLSFSFLFYFSYSNNAHTIFVFFKDFFNLQTWLIFGGKTHFRLKKTSFSETFFTM
jgi:hypothetical protein